MFSLKYIDNLKCGIMMDCRTLLEETPRIEPLTLLEIGTEDSVELRNDLGK